MDFASFADRILGRQDLEIRKYMREVARNLDGLKRKDRKQMLNEIRAHINEKFEETLAENPVKDRAIVAHEVLQEFGEPPQIAKSYMPEGFIPRRESTAVKIVKIFATMVALIIIVPTVFGFLFATINTKTAADAGLLSLSRAYSYETQEQTYYYSFQSTEPKTAVLPENETFYLSQNATKIQFYVVSQSTSGVPGASSVRIQIKNPNGETVYDDTLYSDGTEIKITDCEAVPGAWSLSYTYVAYSGQVVVSATATLVEYCHL
ncbi:MAG: hypothetical protein PHH26_03895 [Candidatus Thermoplasmatota archaeon]|nr:hypothetical protein [Candidatus Thermoplasmatota archaeon]